jgi:hypothetical protein
VRAASPHHRDVIRPPSEAAFTFSRATAGRSKAEWYPVCPGGIHINRTPKGASPADLPSSGANEHSLVIDLKTAKALGLTVPSLLLAQAVRSSNVSLRIESYGSIPVPRTAGIGATLSVAWVTTKVGCPPISAVRRNCRRCAPCLRPTRSAL